MKKNAFPSVWKCVLSPSDSDTTWNWFPLLVAEKENFLKHMLHLESICREQFFLSQRYFKDGLPTSLYVIVSNLQWCHSARWNCFLEGKKMHLISLTHLGINLSILLSELTLKIINVLLPVLTADTQLFCEYFRWEMWKISLCKIQYIIPVVEMQVGLNWVRLPFSASFAEGRSLLEETHIHSCNKIKCYFIPSAFQTV